MTHFLATALGVVEPGFSQTIGSLEQAAGSPRADIRLTEEIKRRTRAKIAELGLDPLDTTAEEFYEALQQRLASDEAVLRSELSLGGSAPADDVIVRVQQFVNKLDCPKTCFALKNSVAKKLLKAKPPKVVMKRLGYRSVDSMLKHEPPALLYTAALISESATWHRTYLEQYAKLTPTDFETRPIALLHPSSKRWQGLADEFVDATRHNILSFKDLGVVVMLPITQRVDGLTFTTLLLVLEEISVIRAHSSLVKLEQVKPDFGRVIRDVIRGETSAVMTVAGQPVNWRMLQRYFAKNPNAYHPEIFEPHVQPEDLHWEHSEDILARLQPSLKFWQGTQALGLMYGRDFVSCNAIDVALGFCNHLPFGERVAHFVRDNIWHELMLRYLNQDNLEQALHSELANELVEHKSSPALT